MKLSVITPLFNRVECAARCLGSVTAQLDSTGMEVEHVVVDDGSTDGSADLLRKYAASHPHVTAVYFPANRGVNAARNAAVKAASGDFAILVDSDDRLAPGALAEIEQAIITHPGIDHLMFTVDDRADEMSAIYGAGGEREFTFSDLLDGTLTGDFAHVIRREVMLRHPYDEHLRIYEKFTVMLIDRDIRRMVFINKVMTERERDRPDSVTRTTVRRNDDVIRRKLRFATLMLHEFSDDYRLYGLHSHLDRLLFQAADNHLLLGEYDEARRYIRRMQPSKRRTALSLIAGIHAAGLYKTALKVYLSVKHKKPERGVN